MVVVQRFAAHEWPLYRHLRLRALADSPDAFGSTFAREVVRSDDDWRERLANGAGSRSDLPLMAVADGSPAGLAWGRLDEREPVIAYLFQVWVAPEFRGRGVGRHLVNAVIAWAATAGARVLRLSVTCGDTTAVRLYRRAGFVDDGPPQPLRPGSEIESQPMRLGLEPSADHQQSPGA
jgi:ribosomal protein S18 acetylase RimI-like enzyme